MIICCRTLFLPNQYKIMSQEIIDNSEKDFKKNWVNSSRFLFYLQVFCIVAFIFGGCYKLYDQRYKGTPDVKVPTSTKYTPEYK
jgi:hypothetical protein